jgi:hypothetical protein
VFLVGALTLGLFVLKACLGPGQSSELATEVDDLVRWEQGGVDR